MTQSHKFVGSGTRSRLVGWAGIGVKGAIALLAMAGVIGLQWHHLKRQPWDVTPQQAEQQEAMRLRLLQQMPTFGFDNVVANWTFLNFLQYYGDEPARNQTGYPLGPAYFDLITQRDPRFVDIYMFLSGTLSYQLGKPQLAIEYLDRGSKALQPEMVPNAFRVWRIKGIDQLLLLGDIPGSIRSHEMAAQWTEETNPELHQMFKETAAFLRSNPNSTPLRIQSWAEIYNQAVAIQDKATQARAKQEIQKIGGQVVEKEGRVYFVAPDPAKRSTPPTRSKAGNSSPSPSPSTQKP